MSVDAATSNLVYQQIAGFGFTIPRDFSEPIWVVLTWSAGRTDEIFGVISGIGYALIALLGRKIEIIQQGLTLRTSRGDTRKHTDRIDNTKAILHEHDNKARSRIEAGVVFGIGVFDG